MKFLLINFFPKFGRILIRKRMENIFENERFLFKDIHDKETIMVLTYHKFIAQFSEEAKKCPFFANLKWGFDKIGIKLFVNS